MYRGTKDIMLPTTITGSLPRPSWYTENLGTRMFLDAMVSRRYREQHRPSCNPIIVGSVKQQKAETAMAALRPLGRFWSFDRF